MDVWIWELLRGIGRAFAQPFLYIAFFGMAWFAVKRIKKERATFGIRIFDRYSDWRGTVVLSIAAGLLLSILAVGGGIVISFSFLLLVSVVLLLVSLTGKSNWYSPAYTLGISYLLLLFLPLLPERYRSNGWVESLEQTPLTGVVLVLAVLLFVEAFLFLKTTPSHTYPERVMGSRGMWIGQHRSRNIAVVPFFALLPSGSIESFVSWWPLFPIGQDGFGLILIPFVMGSEWTARGQAPEVAAKALGRHTFLLAFLVLCLAGASFYIHALSLAAVIVSLLGREMIHILHRVREDRPAFFSSNPKGVRILGILPGSPASQMGLVPGEVIERVNSIPVRTENQFYEALQNTGAFTKLEVRDAEGENRYVQRAMYEGEHFELGIVFVEPPTHESSVGFF
ncbi:PDZ domain-containing protein [Bacillus sp. SB49]|uniref:PDZ domain-containing protein n=1 Tax=Bacillus sp. SB49 TaxID=1071080 RepID=UPI00040029F6|nr:PDZ domain-containing protein [Bacillus sp. SB49]QHT47662.1 PDZ domain-containing protein [Bacillus sp. SB49]